jgi:hypothetical protein
MVRAIGGWGLRSSKFFDIGQNPGYVDAVGVARSPVGGNYGTVGASSRKRGCPFFCLSSFNTHIVYGMSTHHNQFLHSFFAAFESFIPLMLLSQKVKKFG